MTLQERIDQLVKQHGSLRALARVMECSPPYICRLRSGVTRNPGPAVLRKLGLRRVVSYEMLKTPNVSLERWTTACRGPSARRQGWAYVVAVSAGDLLCRG